MRILIVDDCETTQLLQKTILTKVGYTDVATVGSFMAAMDALRQGKDQGDPFDLILMDVTMPVTDGIAATLTIKSIPEFEDLPIIMVTAQDDEEILERAFNAGAIDYIAKPVSRIELRARVRSALQLRSEMLKRKRREKQLLDLAQEMEQLSHRDGLTGLTNRRRFEHIIHREWNRMKRDRQPLAILMIDIDFFKQYNDNLGHVEGDACLKAVAGCIRDAIHRPADFVTRYGGEEFAVVLPQTDAEGAASVAAGLQEQLADLNIAHPASDVGGGLVTVSIGVAALVPNNEGSPEILLSAADSALYVAKKKGRNRVEVLAAPK